MKGCELSMLMQQLGAAIEKLNPRDVQLLLASKGAIDIVVTPLHDGQPNGSNKTIAIMESDLLALVDSLDTSVSRDQGATLLKELSKAQLQALAKHISVSVDSGANKDRLVEKIVERRVGLRLRQDAFAQAMHTD